MAGNGKIRSPINWGRNRETQLALQCFKSRLNDVYYDLLAYLICSLWQVFLIRLVHILLQPGSLSMSSKTITKGSFSTFVSIAF